VSFIVSFNHVARTITRNLSLGRKRGEKRHSLMSLGRKRGEKRHSLMLKYSPLPFFVASLLPLTDDLAAGPGFSHYFSSHAQDTARKANVNRSIDATGHFLSIHGLSFVRYAEISSSDHAH
jgi:hypothetical protein